MASRWMAGMKVKTQAFVRQDIARDSHVTESQRLLVRLHPNDYTGEPIFGDHTRDANRDRSTDRTAYVGAPCPMCFVALPLTGQCC